MRSLKQCKHKAVNNLTTEVEPTLNAFVNSQSIDYYHFNIN